MIGRVGRNRRFVGLVVVGIALAAGGLLWLRRRNASSESVTPQLLDRAIHVLAATENGRQFRDAIAGWSELIAARPNDRDLLLNQAVTVLKWISNTNSVLASGSITDPQQERALTIELQEAYAEAEHVLKRLAESSAAAQPTDGLQALLESALLEARARNLPYPDDVALRKSAAEKLLAALARSPGQPLLSARLFELAQELQNDWPEVTPQATEAAFQAWQAEPRNLYLLVRTGESLLAQRDSRVLQVLDASVELAQPLLPTLPAARQLQPDTLRAEMHAAIAAEDWTSAQRLRAWFNVLRASSAFRADNRLVNPDILALLNTSFLERWRELLPKSRPATSPVASVQVSSQPLPDCLPALALQSRSERQPEKQADSPVEPTVPLLAWYDYDVDRDFDILAIRGRQLRLTPWLEAGPVAAEKIDVSLPLAPIGLCVADLWSVDNPSRPRMPKPSDGGGNPVKGNPAEGNVVEGDAVEGNAVEIDSVAHDTLQEVILWGRDGVIILTRGPQSGTPPAILSDVPGLSSLSGVEEVVPFDLDSDGDLDLAVRVGGDIQLLQNNGNRTFDDISRYSTLESEGWTPRRMIACDYDRDLDVDLVACSSDLPRWSVIENLLHGQFRLRPLDDLRSTTSALRDAAVLEVDGNASWDWCGVGDEQLSGVLTRTLAPGGLVASSSFRRPLQPDADFQLLRAADLNLDGRIDLCLGGQSGLVVYFGDGTSFERAPQSLLDGRPVLAIDIQDADRDGRLEILTVVDGQASLLRPSPDADSSRHYLAARVRGINDVNGGGRINHYAIGSVLELWSNGRYQARVIESPMTHFGLPQARAENLRIVFNNGLTQNVIAPRTDVLLEERQELRGSCPFVYGWNGERFELITDLLWNAPLGLQVARGQVLPDRRWENLVLPGHLVQPHDGAIELRVTEELWEVAYLDHVALTAIDHPASMEVWTNEKVGPPQIAQHRLFQASRPIRPQSARDGKGRDVLDRISRRDRQYVQAFDSQICQGLCEPHSIELSFDPRSLAHSSDVRLVITGWMYPTDTSLNIGISQNPKLTPPQPPSLWTPDEYGRFQCAQPFMGFPGGKPKTIVIDVSQALPKDDARLRIASSQQIYWDEAYLIADEPPAPLRTQSLPLQSADLHYRGFSELMPRASDQPHWYDYTRSNPIAKWPPLEGPFTRFGDVLLQIHTDDDRMVVMTSGDEMALRFALPQLPLPPGWKRDYVLHSVGWDKDADVNTLEGHSSLPLPFSSMTSYPPPLDQADESQRVWQLNADSLTDRSLFNAFWHQETH